MICLVRNKDWILTKALPAQTAPVYISETAPPKWRGALNIMFQLATTVGILIASAINYGAQATLTALVGCCCTQLPWLPSPLLPCLPVPCPYSCFIWLR